MSRENNSSRVLSWDEIDARALPAWYPDAKFGIFVHWGVFSVPAWRTLNDEMFGSYAEWYYASVYGPYNNLDGDFHARNYGSGTTYRDLAGKFRAELFDPVAWADLFRRAGARYVVLTSKHHDGFCMWPTENKYKSGWNASEVGPKRDLLGELSEAVLEQGMRMGLYYSIPEWETHRSHRVDGNYFIPEADAKLFGIDPAAYPSEILHQQWKELNERYAPSVIYTDGGEWDFDEEYTKSRELLSWLYAEAPNRAEVVVNDRIHRGMPGNHGDVFSTEYEDIAGFGASHAWEESRGIGKSYGYNRAENIEDYADAEELVSLLARTVAEGGNLLLNVGPTADGRIPVVQQERLLQIGAWLEANGEAIYGTTPAADIAVNDPGVHITSTSSHRFVIVEADAPTCLNLQLEQGLSAVSAYALGTGEELPFEEVTAQELDGEAGAAGSSWIRLSLPEQMNRISMPVSGFEGMRRLPQTVRIEVRSAGERGEQPPHYPQEAHHES